MNIVFRNLVLLMLLLTQGAPLAFGQYMEPYKPIAVDRNDTLFYSFTTFPIATIKTFPNHGSAWFVNGVKSGNVTLAYLADNTYMGHDTVILEYYPNVPGLNPPKYLAFDFKVQNSILTPHDDYADVAVGSSVTFDVVYNDITSGGGTITLDAIVPLSRHGQATASGSNIIFTPDPGFSGIAQIQYLVCDDKNTCEVGSAFVSVIGTPINDTLQVQTPKNTPTHIFVGMGGGATISQNPTKGSIQFTGADLLLYTPNSNATGNDVVALTKNGVVRRFEIKIFNSSSPNRFAIDDYVYTTMNNPVTFNVLTNDIGNYNVLNPNSITVNKGTLVFQGNNTFLYIPPNNYSGAATFKYKLGFQGFGNNPVETATVHIDISNQAPVQNTYKLTAVQETPLVLKYGPPVSNWNWTIFQQPTDGTLNVYPGQQTININNQQISGYNMIVYTPDAGFVNDTDHFELLYSVGSTNYLIQSNVYVKGISPQTNLDCIDQCIWAGDHNNDGVVNIKDILPIGLMMGVQGFERLNGSTEWRPQSSLNWNDPVNLLNYDLKHIDSDADGIITVADTIAIDQSYGQVHNYTTNGTQKLVNTSVYFEPIKLPDNNNDSLILAIHFGIEPKPVYKAYGFVYNLDFNEEYDSSKIYISYPEQSYIGRESPLLHMTKYPGPNVVQSGISRTNKIGVDGFGVVGFVIVDDIAGGKRDKNASFKMKFSNGFLMNEAGEDFLLPEVNYELGLDTDLSNIQLKDENLFVFPNAASSQVSAYLSDNVMTGYQIYSMDGKLIQSESFEAKKYLQYSVDLIPNGLYLLEIQTPVGTLTRKLMIVH